MSNEILALKVQDFELKSDFMEDILKLNLPELIGRSRSDPNRILATSKLGINCLEECPSSVRRAGSLPPFAPERVLPQPVLPVNLFHHFSPQHDTPLLPSSQPNILLEPLPQLDTSLQPHSQPNTPLTPVALAPVLQADVEIQALLQVNNVPPVQTSEQVALPQMEVKEPADETKLENLTLKFVGFKGFGPNTVEIGFSQKILVEDLKAFLGKNFGIPEECLLLVYGNTFLSNENTLESYSISFNSTILVLVREGIDSISEEDTFESKLTTKRLIDPPNNLDFVTRKFTFRDPILMVEVDNCYSLPCGHGITVTSLIDHFRSNIKSRDPFRCVCPREDGVECSQSLSYAVVKKILASSFSEENTLRDQYNSLEECLQAIEIEAGKGLIRKYTHFQKCCHCDSLLFRLGSDPKTKIGKCRVCYFNNKEIDFCWICGKNLEYVENDTEPKCTNPNCVSRHVEETFSIVSTCDPKTISSTDEVPEIRACPCCCQLIHHIDGCKHMQCSRCDIQFCFVCMELFDETNGWPCGDSYDVCPIYKYESGEHLPQNFISSLPFSEEWK